MIRPSLIKQLTLDEVLKPMVDRKLTENIDRVLDLTDDLRREALLGHIRVFGRTFHDRTAHRPVGQIRAALWERNRLDVVQFLTDGAAGMLDADWSRASYMDITFSARDVALWRLRRLLLGLVKWAR